MCFNGQSEFEGTLTLTPSILTGNGKMHFSGALLESKLMKFQPVRFTADTSDFFLRSDQSSQLADLAFATSNVNAKVDFEKRMAEFKSNGKGSIVKFPANQYICYMDKFKWYMDKNEIELGDDDRKIMSNNEIDLDAPEFISIHPKQDSLRFPASFLPRAGFSCHCIWA